MKQLDVNNYSFCHFTLIMPLHYLVKCRSRRLAVYIKEFILASAYIGSENHWNFKIIENVQFYWH